MNMQVYSGVLDVSALQPAVEELRSQAAYSIVESLTEIDFPPPKKEAINVAEWPKGRIFCTTFELRWEQIGSSYRTIFAGEEDQEPPAGLAQQVLVIHLSKEKKYYCWNETNPRLGRTLNYRCVPGEGNVKLVVKEYRDDHGRLVFWRHLEMKREGNQ